MSGISPKLPLYKDKDDGLGLNKTYKEAIQQNMIVLLMTNPGERIMDPEFGCGLRHILFHQNNPGLYGQIDGRIRQQVRKYINFVEIENINIIPPNDNTNQHRVDVSVSYFIKPLSVFDNVFIEIDNGVF